MEVSTVRYGGNTASSGGSCIWPVSTTGMTPKATLNRCAASSVITMRSQTYNATQIAISVSVTYGRRVVGLSSCSGNTMGSAGPQHDAVDGGRRRSEEHTSELQSQSNLV